MANTRTHLFTSESVSMGHPDKVSDAVSDAILDSLLAHDPFARVACETLVTTGTVVLAGEITVHNEKANAALGKAEETAREAIRLQDSRRQRDEVDAFLVAHHHGRGGRREPP